MIAHHAVALVIDDGQPVAVAAGILGVEERWVREALERHDLLRHRKPVER